VRSVVRSITYVSACRTSFLLAADPSDPRGRRNLMLDNGGNLSRWSKAPSTGSITSTPCVASVRDISFKPSGARCSKSNAACTGPGLALTIDSSRHFSG
jgi:hypothetical protein